MPKSAENTKVVLLAQTNFRNQKTKFGIKPDDRRRHMYLIGKTGMGKSTAMENMIIQDIYNGQGLALVDPHGDLAEKILDFIPSHRINDVIYFNPADIDNPIAFNIMEAIGPNQKHLIASGLVGVFKKLWADSWGPRLEYLLRNAILALLDYPGSTLLGIMRIFVDKTYRKKIIAKIDDPVVKAFWIEEYSKYPQNFQVEAVAPIQNKVGQLLSTAMIRNIVGQVKSSFDLREVMDQKKILIMNLSKGRIGEDSSALLGAVMITKIQLAAMSRVDTPEEERQDFYLYVDEFQNFATDSFANILSEARKYRLNLIIGHQYIEQLEEVVRAAVFGNVGTMMVFRVGSADADFLETEFTPYFEPTDLVNLTKYDVYMKLMIDGVSSNPFSATTLPPIGGSEYVANREKVIRVSQERYGKPREEVEEKISKWSGVMTAEDLKARRKEESEMEMEVSRQRKEAESYETNGEKSNSSNPSSNRNNRSRNARPSSNNSNNRDRKESDKEERPDDSSNQSKKDDSKKKGKVTFIADCYECGKETQLNFRPDGVRPIYCTSCYDKIKRDGIKSQKDEKVEEEADQQPAISLSEALSQEVVNFDGSKKKPSPPKDEPTKTKPQEIASQSNSQQNSQIKSQADSRPSHTSTNPQKVSPGQVIKF